MRRFWKLALLAAITLAPVATVNADDADISRQIVEQLNSKKSEGSLKGFNIGLSVENGVVWLEGHVSDKAQHDMAINIARRVEGVEQVVDGVTVNQPNAPTVQGVLVSAAETVAPEGQPRELRAQPIYSDLPRTASAAPLAPQMLRPLADDPQQTPTIASRPMYQQQQQGQYQDQAQTPGQMPRAFAPAGTQDFRMASARMQPPVPIQAPSYYPTASGYASPVRYDNPQMPGYAWPAYAAYPNYAALQYPKQYSPAAWPYVGPFYPYPQVPLGWRKVTMEFNKGWWTVDFKARRHGRW